MKRVLDLPGAVNLRDFGGYTTTDGERVKPALLYRSGMMANMTANAQDEFRALGIKVICDLRRQDERDNAPTPFPEDDPRLFHIAMDPGSGVAMHERTRQGQFDLDERIRFMTDINRELARDHVPHYRRVFQSLMHADGSGFLIHCTAGKDRTGFGAAVILLALGVDHDTVMEDYLLTNEAMDFETFILPRLRDAYGDHMTYEDARAASGVRAEYLHAAFEEVERAFGSFARYLRDGLGVDAGDRQRLREQYLV